MAATTAMLSQFRGDLLLGGHCFAATVTKTGTTTTNQATVTSLSSITSLAVGMGLSGGGFPVGTVIASIDSTSQITASKNSTAGASGATLTLTGDPFKVALIRVSMAGNYDAASTGYGNITGNSDEVSGTGYTAGGAALTNVAPSVTGGVAVASFGNPSWSAASFSFRAAMFYNAGARLGVANRGVAVFDFGSDQAVSGGGTVTLIIPSVSSSSGLIRI